MTEPNSNVAEAKANVILTILVVAALAAWLAYSTGLFNFEPKSLLDEITQMGVSTNADFGKFRDEGGLNKNPAWHGLYIANIRVSYNGEGDTLSEVSMKAEGKARYLSNIKEWTHDDAAPKEYRSILATVCKLPESGWTITESGGSSEATANGKTIRCGYVRADNSSNDTLIFIERK